jgi:hypothetical protein
VIEIRAESETYAAGPSTEQSQRAEESAIEKPKSKRSKTSRRSVAKSEPNRFHDSHDGAQDLDMTAIGSGDGQLLLQTPSVVSPPTVLPMSPA